MIKNYNDLATKPMEDDLKIVILLEGCPKVLQQHLRLNINSFEDSYDKFREGVQNFINSEWNLTDEMSGNAPVPMKCDLAYKGGRKGGTSTSPWWKRVNPQAKGKGKKGKKDK